LAPLGSKACLAQAEENVYPFRLLYLELVAACATILMLHSSRPAKHYPTTKHTKATKVSDIDISKVLNFVLFVTFVVKLTFSTLVAASPRWALRGELLMVRRRTLRVVAVEQRNFNKPAIGKQGKIL
jgi:hypothetical protein